MYRASKAAALFLAFAASSSVGATVYSCYSGKVNFKGLNFSEVRLRFTDTYEVPYSAIFLDGQRKAGTDMACSKGIVGTCALTDTSGRLKVSEFDAEKIVFTFSGLPSIVKRADSDWPFVDGTKPATALGPVTLRRDKNLKNCEY